MSARSFFGSSIEEQDAAMDAYADATRQHELSDLIRNQIAPIRIDSQEDHAITLRRSDWMLVLDALRRAAQNP